MDLCLNEKEIRALKDEVYYIFELYDTEQIARQGLQIAAILDYIFTTKIGDEHAKDC